MNKIVVLGGGYGGLRTVNELLEKKLPKETTITLIDRTPYHSLKTEFYALAAGTISDREVRIDFPEDDRLEIISDEITKIDLEKKEIHLREKEKVNYNFLVIALGCEDHYHDIQGAKEHTLSVQTINKSRIAYEKISNLGSQKNVTIVGAGLSGVELASELRESRKDLNIVVLDRGTSVLRPFDKKVQEYVEEWFKENDVKVIHNSHVEYVEPNAICDNGSCIQSDAIVWTAGVRPNYLVRSLPLLQDKHERIIINDFHQVPAYNEIYVVGDCASLPYSPSAQLAEQQGVQVAEIIFQILKGENPKKPSAIQLKGVLGSLGKKDGFGSVLNKPMTGLFPRIVKTGVLWLHKRHN